MEPYNSSEVLLRSMPEVIDPLITARHTQYGGADEEYDGSGSGDGSVDGGRWGEGGLRYVVMEGRPDIIAQWTDAVKDSAMRHRVDMEPVCVTVSPQEWRKSLLLPNEVRYRCIPQRVHKKDKKVMLPC